MASDLVKGIGLGIGIVGGMVLTALAVNVLLMAVQPSAQAKLPSYRQMSQHRWHPSYHYSSHH